MNKKGLGVGEVFVFIVAAITFSLIMIFGYRAVNSFLSSGEQVAFVQFKNDLENSVTKIYTEYGALRTEDFTLPSKYEQICFVDLDHSFNPNNGLCNISAPACVVWRSARDAAANSTQTPRPTAYDSVDENVFLKPLAPVKMKVHQISIAPSSSDEGYICLPIHNGVFSLRLEGKGDHTELSRVSG